MIRSILGLLTVGTVLVYSKRCVDGKNNVIQIYDTTKGKGQILVKDLEIGTYDKDKKPICAHGRPRFTFPGYIKVLKGTVEVVEPVKESKKDKLMLEFTVEKDSVIIGVVCDKGVSKNQFVPNEMCKMDLCSISSMCGLLSVKTPTPLNIAQFVGKEYIDFGPMPIPQLSGDWKLSVNLVQGNKQLVGLRARSANDQWLTIKSLQEGEEDEQDPYDEDHDEL
ncbi:hypothetical protein GCK32_016468 [Trichostrongylus colubriformis]|uniref:Uncharacterized protein n=1 Tax=Trichostrongylus colubriformis TaxID=6319 RepID=A0AAN8GFD8_TRICO